MKKLFEITVEQFISQGLRGSTYSSTKDSMFHLGSGIDPFAVPGLLQGGLSTTDIGGATVVDTINYFLTTTGSANFFFGYGTLGHIYRINLGTDGVEDLRTVANSTGLGFELYKSAIYYSRDGNLGKMTSIEATPPTFNDAFAAFTNTTAGTEHPLHAFAGTLYCGDKDHLDSNDGTTHTNNVLDFDSDFTVIDIDDDGYYLVIAAVKKAGSGLTRVVNKLFFWDRFSPSWNVEWEINEGTLTGISKKGEGIKMIAFAGSGAYEFSYASSPTPMFEGSSSSNAPVTVSDLQPFAGAINFWKGQMAWASNGNIWTYGRVLPTFPKILCTPIALTAIKSFYVDGFSRIYASTTNNKLFKVASGNTASSFRTGTFDLGGTYHIRGLKLHTFFPFTGSQSIQAQLTNEDTGTANVDETFNNANDGGVNRTFWRNVSFRANYLRVLITFASTVTFKKLEVWGDPIDERTTFG